MVADPKPHQTGRKRQNVAKTGNDWEYYYDSYYSTAPFAAVAQRLAPPLKRPRLIAAPSRSSKKQQQQQQQQQAQQAQQTTQQQQQQQQQQTVPQPLQPQLPQLQHQQSPPPPTTTQQTTTVSAADLSLLKTYSNPDVLICGNCRELFTDLGELIEHRKSHCKLRFACKCRPITPSQNGGDGGSAVSLLCVSCKASFTSAWDLMVHVQAAHMLNIYELGSAEQQQQQQQQQQQALPQPSASPEQQMKAMPHHVAFSHAQALASCSAVLSDEHAEAAVLTNGWHKENGTPAMV